MISGIMVMIVSVVAVTEAVVAGWGCCQQSDDGAERRMAIRVYLLHE